MDWRGCAGTGGANYLSILIFTTLVFSSEVLGILISNMLFLEVAEISFVFTFFGRTIDRLKLPQKHSFVK